MSNINWDKRKLWKIKQEKMDDEEWRSIYNSEMLAEVPVNFDKPPESYRAPVENILLSKLEFGMLYPYFRGPRYADIGCGPGNLPNCVASKHPDWECHGIDISDEMVRYGAHVATQMGIKNVEFKACSLESLRGLEFDTVSMYETVEHLWNVEDGLRQVVSLLAPAGRLMGTVPHKNYADGGLHFHYFEPKSLVEKARGILPLNAALMKINPYRIIFWTSNIEDGILEHVDTSTIQMGH